MTVSSTDPTITPTNTVSTGTWLEISNGRNRLSVTYTTAPPRPTVTVNERGEPRE